MNFDFLFTVIIFILLFIGFLATLFIVVPFVVKHIKKTIFIIKKNINQRNVENGKYNANENISKFLSSEKPGIYFFRLIKTNVISTILCENFGEDFPDDKQRSTFIKYSTNSIAKELDKIGESV